MKLSKIKRFVLASKLTALSSQSNTGRPKTCINYLSVIICYSHTLVVNYTNYIPSHELFNLVFQQTNANLKFQKFYNPFIPLFHSILWNSVQGFLLICHFNTIWVKNRLGGMTENLNNTILNNKGSFCFLF